MVWSGPRDGTNPARKVEREDKGSDGFAASPVGGGGGGRWGPVRGGGAAGGGPGGSGGRQIPRLRIRVPVLLLTSKGGRLLGHTQDLSLLGTFVELSTLPDIGAHVLLEFGGTREDPGTIRLEAQVVWSSHRGVRGCGVRFDEAATQPVQWNRFLQLYAYYQGGGTPVPLSRP